MATSIAPRKGRWAWQWAVQRLSRAEWWADIHVPRSEYAQHWERSKNADFLKSSTRDHSLTSLFLKPVTALRVGPGMERMKGNPSFSHLRQVFLFLKNFLIFGCAGSSLLHIGFPQLQRAGLLSSCGVRASHCGGFSCCGVVAPQAHLLHGMWNLPGRGIEPMSPALAGRLLSTLPLGKSWGIVLQNEMALGKAQAAHRKIASEGPLSSAKVGFTLSRYVGRALVSWRQCWWVF